MEGVGFVQAGSLKPGDKVRLADGRNLEVCEIEVEHLSEPVYVYNFEVEDYHTYFVSELGVLVHNDCGPGTQGIKKPNYEGRVKNGGGQPPENFSPEGAGRNGAFREAKRASGIPVTEQPKAVRSAVDRNGNRIPGRDYFFDNNKVIREHFGHEYSDDAVQNRGNHFNDIYGNHYDY